MTEPNGTSIEEVCAEIRVYGRRHPNPYERWGKSITREVTELRAENERLNEVIDRAAKAWMSLEPPVAWEGDVADAMAAGVAEIERLNYRLSTLEEDRLERDAEIERLKEQLERERQQAREAIDAVRNGEPLGSIAGKHMIRNQQVEIERLRVEVRELRADRHWLFDIAGAPRNTAAEKRPVWRPRWYL